MRIGGRLKSVVCDTEVIVIRARTKVDTLNCGGEPMSESRDDQRSGRVDPAFAGGTLLGKRYVDAEGTFEVLCTKGGAGALSIGAAPLAVKDAKALPTSD